MLSTDQLLLQHHPHLIYCYCSLFLDKEEDNVIRLSSLEDDAAAAETPEQVHAVYKRFVNFHGELLLMVHWSILAYTGLVKILKKHHKRTGLLVRAPHLDNLLSQPFCSVEVHQSNDLSCCEHMLYNLAAL